MSHYEEMSSIKERNAYYEKKYKEYTDHCYMNDRTPMSYKAWLTWEGITINN